MPHPGGRRAAPGEHEPVPKHYIPPINRCVVCPMKSLFCQVLPIFLLALGLQGIAGAKQASIPAGGTADACSWNRPGVNPFTGDVVAAVDRYTDIPVEVRERLKSRMAKREYDDMVTIRRDGISGRNGYDYGQGIRDMHFGPGKVCRTVSRKAWSSKTVERGLVYCESGQCILVPTVCRNVSRITRRGVSDGNVGGGTPGQGPSDGSFASGAGPQVASAGGPSGGASSTGLPAIGEFAPPGAGNGTSSTATSAGGGGADGPAAGGGGTTVGSGPGLPGVVYGPGTSGGGVVGPVAGTGGTGGEVGVSPIPEPQTWALMVGGLLALAIAARRRPADALRSGVR
jgi:hypothetical protein